MVSQEWQNAGSQIAKRQQDQDLSHLCDLQSCDLPVQISRNERSNPVCGNPASAAWPGSGVERACPFVVNPTDRATEDRLSSQVSPMPTRRRWSMFVRPRGGRLAPLALLLLPLLVPGSRAPAQDAPPAYTNPVYGKDFPDPFVLADGGKYYAYATQTRGTGFQLMESPDLVHWTNRVLDFPIPWSREHYWAPEVVHRGAKYYLTYSARDPREQEAPHRHRHGGPADGSVHPPEPAGPGGRQRDGRDRRHPLRKPSPRSLVLLRWW